jgi:hypothetical protein
MVYFSERELGPQPRTRENIPANVWQGIVAAIQSRIRDGSFGREFPGQCPDGIGVAGTNEYLMTQAILAQFPQLHWPPNDQNPPQQYEVLDLIEFCHARVAMPRHIGDYHEWYGHYHLVFNVPAGKDEFRNIVNQIFARNGLAYDLQENGEIVRLAPHALREGLAVALFQTGDPQLDRLLEIARHRFLDPNPGVRMDGLEKLFRQTLELESRALTDIGNKYMIRHTEVGKIPIQTVEQMDYFFHRMFALISLLLRATGRGG